MNRQQVQEAMISRALSRKGQNTYTQGASRDKVAWGYSDCSSFARWCARCVTGADIGSYTGAQVTDGDMVTVHQGGKYPDLSLLEKGDFIYFRNDKSTYKYGVSHVEVLWKVGGALGDCWIIGHGGGMGPTVKNLRDYCASRNYLMTRRLKVLDKTWALGQRTIEKGCYGEDVRELQRGLIALGYPVGSSGADWDCGDATDAAIRRMQKAHRLTVDGQFGQASLAKYRELMSGCSESVSDEPLTEDDYPAIEDGGADEPGGDPADDPTGEHGGDAGPEADRGPNADGSMGGASVNPYPVPTSVKRVGSRGPAVKWIQWELLQSGYDCGSYGPGKDGIDGDYGSATLRAVKAFQALHTDADGRALVIDGEVGLRTRRALAREDGPCVHGGAKPPEPSVDSGGSVYDVSTYDGSIDYDQVVSLAGDKRCMMLIIRAQGRGLDDRLSRNITKCKQHGIPYGVYAYTYAGTKAAAIADADRFYDRVIAAGGEPLCWVIDAEEGANTKDAIEAMRMRLRERIGGDGAIWFYSFDARVRDWAKIMSNYDGVWTARWNTPDIAPGYRDYSLWQHGYTHVPGISKATDTSRLHPQKTLEQVLARRAGKKGEE